MSFTDLSPLSPGHRLNPKDLEVDLKKIARAAEQQSREHSSADMRQSRVMEPGASSSFGAADEAARLRVLASLQEELATGADDLPALLMHVATRAQQLLDAEGAAIEITPPGGGGASRVTTGSANSPQICLPLWGGHWSDGLPGDTRDAALRSLMSVPVSSSRHRFGFLAVLCSPRGPLQAQRKEMLRLVSGMLATRLDALQQVQEQEGLLTENAIAMATLRESESRFREAFDNSGIGMALVASDGRWLKVNAALCRTLGYATAELLTLQSHSLTDPGDAKRELSLVRRLLVGEIPTYELEKRCLRKDGRVVWVETTVSAVKDDQGQILYLVSQLQDISARKDAEEVLRRLAIRDSLTGLFNRGELDRRLDEEIARARRHGRALSLLMVDVDRFKQVNDTCGHPAGDRALQEVAGVLADCVRLHDHVGRYGGEEFAIILPETTGADAFAVAERMRARIEAEVSVSAREGQHEVGHPITISVGIATFQEGGNSQAEELVRDADAGLYAAKSGGRNRCVVTAPPARQPL